MIAGVVSFPDRVTASERHWTQGMVEAWLLDRRPRVLVLDQGATYTEGRCRPTRAFLSRARNRGRRVPGRTGEHIIGV